MTLTRLERPVFAAMHGPDLLYFAPDPGFGVSPMRRREFITLLGGAAAWVSPARAQEPRRVIGFLTGFRFPGPLMDVGVPAFLQGLKDAGFVEGRNISIEIRHADGHYDRLPSLAAELVGGDVAAIFA